MECGILAIIELPWQRVDVFLGWKYIELPPSHVASCAESGIMLRPYKADVNSVGENLCVLTAVNVNIIQFPSKKAT